MCKKCRKKFQHSLKKQASPASQGRSKPQDQVIPNWYCFKFHRGVSCDSGFAFKYLCYKCDGPHPVSRCNFRGQSRTSSNRPLPAKSQQQSHNLQSQQQSHNLPTPVIVERLDFFLSGYNHSIAAFLSSGFREGFPLHYEGDPGCSDAKNLVSDW